MRELTDYQKNFLLEYFFKDENQSGWRNIATRLLENGFCIVANKEPVWRVGIGNFIKTEKAKTFVDCVKLTFNLEYFLKSEWYKEISDLYLAELWNKKIEIGKEYKQINLLFSIEYEK